MKLNKMSKEDLELLSNIEIAKLYLQENKKTFNTAELFQGICLLLEKDAEDNENELVDFFHSLTTSKDFILLNDGRWDLKNNHSIKVDMDEVYEEKDDELIEIEDVEEEDDDLDSKLDSTSTEDDDYDDELADLTIIEEEDLDN